MATPRLIIARHGETPFNAKGLVRGWTNVPLNAKGRQEAKRLARRLAKEPIARIYTSDLSRARETAEAIARTTGAPVTPTKRLRPWHLGVWEAKPIKDTIKRRLELIRTDRSDAPKGGESFNSFSHRFIDFLTEMQAKAIREGKTYCLVCHTHNQRLALSWVMPPEGELTLKPLIDKTELAPAGFLTIEYHKGKWSVTDKEGKFASEDSPQDLRLADPPQPEDDDPDAWLAWWLATQPAVLGSIYADAFNAGADAFQEQFPEIAVDAAALDANDAFQATVMANHSTSIARMYGELKSLVGTGGGSPEALDDWFNQNVYRLDLTGDSLAWAAEQHGYYEAGQGQPGLEIDWELGPVKTEHCGDCLDLAAGGPYTGDAGENPLPSVPGDGSTECGNGCQCSLSFHDASASADDNAA